MAAPQDYRLGPFVGGLNTFSDPTAIGDDEIAELINFEMDIDGSLVNRPPITQVGTAEIPGGAGNGISVLGYYEADGGAKYLIATNRTSATYYFTGNAWVLITDKFAATAIAQYRSKLWLVAPTGSTNPGGSWSPSGGFVADSNMPKGGCAVAYKDRIFIGSGENATSNGARMYLSDLNAVWPSTPNAFNVGSGDGQTIVDMALYSDSIVIFKQSSTYRYAYSSDPALGQVVPISYNIGALSRGCYAAYQNQLYVLFDNKVYEFSSFNYNELNLKVPLKALNPSASLTENASISVWSDRVIVQYYDQTYAYSLKTNSWSVWEANAVTFMGRFWPIPGQQTSRPIAYTYSTSRTGFLGLYQIIDEVGSAKETMQCKFVSKNYDYLDSAKFKRLITWGVDAISKVKIKGTVTPVTYGGQVTWDQLKQGSNAPTPWSAPPSFPGDGGTAYVVDEANNLIFNPSFELPGAENAAVAGWLATTGSAASAPVCTALFPAMAGRVGTYIARAVSNGSNARLTVRPVDDIPVTPGKWYLFRCWAACDTSATRTFVLSAGHRGTAGTILRYTGSTLPSTNFGFYPGGYASTIFTAQADTVSVSVSAYMNESTGNLASGARLWLDQMLLLEFNSQAEAQAAQAMYDAYGYFDLTTSTAASPVVQLPSGKLRRYRPYTEPNGYTWGYLKSKGATWDRLVSTLIGVTDEVETAGSGTGRKYIKFNKSVRFRQIGFTLEAETDGDTTTAPLRIFSLMTYIATKQRVSKKIS